MMLLRQFNNRVALSSCNRPIYKTQCFWKPETCQTVAHGVVVLVTFMTSSLYEENHDLFLAAGQTMQENLRPFLQTVVLNLAKI